MVSIVQTTVIIPVFNGEIFVRQAVASVLDQLEAGDELLVVDDASTDATRQLLELPDTRLRVLAGPGLGPSAARNIGLLAARGEFIAFLDHDDLWPAGRHGVLRDALLADPSADAAAGRIRLKVEAGSRAGVHDRLDGEYGPSLPWTCLFRRRIIEKAGGFAEDMRYGEDLDYYLRLVEAGMKTSYRDHDSLVYRRHASNATNSAPADGRLMLEIVARKLARSRGQTNAQG